MVMDVAIYDENLKAQIIKDVIVNDQEITEVPLTFQPKPFIVFLNHGDHSYAKLRFDPLSL